MWFIWQINLLLLLLLCERDIYVRKVSSWRKWRSRLGISAAEPSARLRPTVMTDTWSRVVLNSHLRRATLCNQTKVSTDSQFIQEPTIILSALLRHVQSERNELNWTASSFALYSPCTVQRSWTGISVQFSSSLLLYIDGIHLSCKIQIVQKE